MIRSKWHHLHWMQDFRQERRIMLYERIKSHTNHSKTVYPLIPNYNQGILSLEWSSSYHMMELHWHIPNIADLPWCRGHRHRYALSRNRIPVLTLMFVLGMVMKTGVTTEGESLGNHVPLQNIRNGHCKMASPAFVPVGQDPKLAVEPIRNN